MKKATFISLGFSMLISFVMKAQERTVSKDTLSSSLNNKVIICSPSRSNTNEPLYILNGVLIDTKQFSKINPNDIEDIRILKDTLPSSFSCRTHNEIIIVKTKKD